VAEVSAELLAGQTGSMSSGWVPWIYLVATLIGLLHTYNAFWPVRRNKVLFVWSFFASWLTIEGAWFHIAWQMAATAVFVSLGALDTWPGWLGLALSLVSWVGLVVLWRQSRATSTIVDTSIADVTGAQAHGKRGRRRHVRITRDVVYATEGGQRQKLDVFQPAEAAPGDRRPVILQIHGGAWVLGSKNEQGLPLLRRMVANGWIGVNANYRLCPAATWPEPLVDLKRAVAWVRGHADEYGMDPSFIAVTGGSAGGHLTALMALTANDPRYQPGFEDADTSLQAAVPFYGVYDWTNRSGASSDELRRWLLEPLIVKAFYDQEPERFRDASPIDVVHADAPPFFVLHGDHDTLAPVQDARLFVDGLRAVSTEPVLYAELAGAQHAFDVFTSPRTERAIRGVERFLRWARAEADPTQVAADQATLAETVAGAVGEAVDVDGASVAPSR